MKTIIAILERKGIWCTLLGIAIAFFTNYPALVNHWSGETMDQEYLIQAIVFNIIAVIFIILPSKVIVEALKFKFIVED